LLKLEKISAANDQRCGEFFATFSRYFPISPEQFSLLLVFPFITQLFAFNFNPNENYLLTSNRQAATLSHSCSSMRKEALLEKAFKFYGLCIHERRQRHDVEKISFTKRKEGKSASETRDVIYFNISWLFGIRDDVRKRSERMRPSFCEGPLNGAVFLLPLHRKLIKILLHLSLCNRPRKNRYKKGISRVFTVKFLWFCFCFGVEKRR
jgi:hypothetical protein